MEDKISVELRSLGYTPVQKRVFVTPWSSDDVKHFVYLDWRKKHTARISVQVGIHHQDAETFAASIVRMYGPSPLRELIDLGRTKKNGSLIQFNLGSLCSWPDLWSLDPAKMGVDECAGEVIGCLQNKLFPLVGHVRTDGSMYEYLTQKKIEALYPANAAARAAEAILLGKRLNLSEGAVISDIEHFKADISSQIDHSIAVDEFLAQVWLSA